MALHVPVCIVYWGVRVLNVRIFTVARSKSGVRYRGAGGGEEGVENIHHCCPKNTKKALTPPAKF